MLNKGKHQLIMGRILQDIYSDTSISSLIGFKGGTCAYFFYGLLRFSVDLDFDVFSSDEVTHQKIVERIGTLLVAHGAVKEHFTKRHTLFFLLSYGDADHNIKVEINTRMLIPTMKDHYELKEYLGIPMFVGKKEYLFASKLAALTDRRVLAMRDIYDVWFFARNNWDIDTDVLTRRTGKTVSAYLDDCIAVIEHVKDNEILRGLAELLPDEKAKIWVKSHLRKEVVLLLKNYQSVLRQA